MNANAWITFGDLAHLTIAAVLTVSFVLAVCYLPEVLAWCDRQITRGNNETLRKIREQEIKEEKEGTTTKNAKNAKG